MSESATDQGARIAFSTLGCKLNLYETDALAAQFEEAGYEIVDFDEPAEVYVVNTCTVTNKADRKSRNLFYRAKRRANTSSDPLVVLAGCYVNSHADELEGNGRTLVVPNERKNAIYDIVEATRRGEMIVPPAGGATRHSAVFDFPVPTRRIHTRTMIKVQDGCDNFCAFCIIPQVRGRAVSRPPADVIDAAREAIEGGARELVLTGVNMSRYRFPGGRADIQTSFASLVEQILELSGAFRLRISSLEPESIDDRFIDLFQHPKMCSHLHLCLQSGSDRILLSMRRQYTYPEFVRIAERLRARNADFNITTDIITGFPGENDADFQASLEAIRELQFGHVHTFPYSERGGTRAERMPQRVPERLRSERAAEVRSVAAAVKRGYRERFVGTTQVVLIEKSDSEKGVASGLTAFYVPVKIGLSEGALQPGEAVHNTLREIRIHGLESADDPALLGSMPSRAPASA